MAAHPQLPDRLRGFVRRMTDAVPRERATGRICAECTAIRFLLSCSAGTGEASSTLSASARPTHPDCAALHPGYGADMIRYAFKPWIGVQRPCR